MGNKIFQFNIIIRSYRKRITVPRTQIKMNLIKLIKIPNKSKKKFKNIVVMRRPLNRILIYSLINKRVKLRPPYSV